MSEAPAAPGSEGFVLQFELRGVQVGAEFHVILLPLSTRSPDTDLSNDRSGAQSRNLEQVSADHEDTFSIEWTTAKGETGGRVK